MHQKPSLLSKLIKTLPKKLEENTEMKKDTDK